jgi:beta-phosphoglucomutase-like phosphatase (HAD superfamily)
VASNSPRALVEAALETAGLGGVFDSVIGADDVREPKPAPEAYLLSCGVLGARPGRGVALEGSPTGAAAARGAGSYVIEVPSTPGVAPDAHGVVGSLTEAAVRRAVSLATTWGR